jgi:hypothetical protein
MNIGSGFKDAGVKPQGDKESGCEECS